MPGKRILVIDDEVVFLDLLKTFLEEKGYEVTTASSGQRILNLLFERPYDLVLLDVWMVDGSGLDVFKKIRKANPGLPVVLMTGYASSTLVSALSELNPEAFVTKPFKLTELLQTIRTLLAAAATGAPRSGKTPPPAAQPAPVGRYRLLIADDDEGCRTSLREMFAAHGFEAITAADGEEAWSLLQEHPEVNVLVLDVAMPRLDGVRLLKRVKAHNPDALAIFITAVDDPKLHQELVTEQGAYAVFQKPFGFHDFLRFVEMAEQVARARRP